MRRVISCLTVITAGAIGVSAVWARPACAQALDEGARGPRFLLASSASPAGTVPLDVRRTPMLRRRIALRLDGVTVKEALAAIARQAGLDLAYTEDAVPLHQRVHLRADEITVAAALTDVLVDANVDVVFTPDGRAVLKQRMGAAPLATGALSGRVTDAETGEGLPGAEVLLEGTAKRTLADNAGQFRLAEIEPGTYTITARRIGYAKQSRSVTLAVGEEVVADFALRPVPTTLDEIVTTVTGDQRRSEIGHVVASIAADSVVATAPVMNLADVLSGRAAGVQVYFNGGLTGASPQVNIRGLNSLSLSSQPLLVVDGVRVDNSHAETFFGSNLAATTAGRFNDLQPSEIESIEIVKGPSASTLYGTDAANGVIVVKTKRGRPGPARVSVFTEGGAVGFSRDRFPENYFPWGHTPSAPGTPMQCGLGSVAAGVCVQDSISRFGALRNAETTPIGAGNRRAVGAQVAGGSDVRYFLSATGEREIGYLRMPDADRAILAEQRGSLGLTDEELRANALTKYSVRANADAPLGGKATIGVSTALVSQASRIPLGSAITFGELGPGYRDANDGWAFGVRPGDFFLQRHSEALTRFTGSVHGEWQALSWLSLRGTTGLDFSSTFYDGLMRRGEGLSGARLGERLNTKTNVTVYSVDLGGTASFRFARWLGSRTSAGVQYNRSRSLRNTAGATDLAPGSTTVAGGAVQTASEATDEAVIAGSYVEQSVSLRERLFLTGALRADGASSFGRDFKTAVYPKASLSWRISDEPFWPGRELISSLRLRAAIGASGVQPGSLAALAREELFPVFVDGAGTTGAVRQSPGNPDLKPERQREIEAGFDLELWNGRVVLEGTYYNKRSSDALIDLPLPLSSGGGSQLVNVGAVRNRGIEGMLHARVLQGRRFGWEIGLNGSLNDNELLTLGPSVSPTYGQFGGTSIVPGYPLYAFFDYPILGYADADGNGILQANELTIGDSPVYRGSSYPRTSLAATSAVSLFGDRVRLSAQVDHRGGFRIANRVASGLCFFGYCRAAADPTTPFEDQVAAVGYAAGGTHWGFFQDGSFTRLRELALSYELPSGLTRRLGARGATLTIAGRNLALWTSYPGVDPEVSTIVGMQSFGAFNDTGGLPPARYWLLRVRVDF